MNIRPKIILANILIVVICAAVGALIIRQLMESTRLVASTLEPLTEDLTQDSYLNSLAVEISYYDEVLTQSARNYAFTQDKKWKTRYKESEPLLDGIIKDAMARGGEAELSFFSSVDQANLALVELEYRSIDHVDQGRAKQAIELLESDEYWRLKAVYKQGLDSYVKNKGGDLAQATQSSALGLQQAIQQVESRFTIQIRLFILFIAVGTLICLLISSLLSNLIVRNVSRLSRTMDRAASGDLTARSEVKSKDQIGLLAKNFNIMMERLTHTEDYIANIIKTAPIILLVTDETGKINKVNDAALRALGYQAEEILGQKVERFFASLSIKQLAGENKIENIRSVLKTKNGDTVPVSLSVGIVDGAGTPRGFVFAAKDLRELADYARQRLAKITPVLQKVSIGDFSEQLEVSKDKDEFTEYLTALNATISKLKGMYDDIKHKIQELEAQNEKLEQAHVELGAARSNLEGRVEERTKELEAAKENLEQKVAERTEELLKLNEKLEQEVAERTGDLQEKLSELEGFNKLMVGREIEMVKLKEELAGLKKSLKS